MKKTLSLLLALCMLLALAPVTAETSPVSGTWYLTAMGMTAATFELNEDGSCVMTSGSESQEQQNGTWTMENNQVSITFNNETLKVNYDGTNLLFSQEQLEEMNQEGSQDSEFGAFLSGLGGLMQFSREPGKISAEEWSAYSENGTIPEGKTEEDMKTIEAEIMAGFMSLLGSMNPDTATEEPGPEVTVLEENFYLREGFDETQKEGVYFAKVRNDHDTTVNLSHGTLTLLDDQNNTVGQSEYLGTTGSCYLEPGEETFVSMYADVNAGASVSTYSATLKTSTQPYWTQDVAVDVAATELRVDPNDSSSYSSAVTITNTTEETLPNINVVVAVRSSDGKIVDLASTGLYQNELPAGSSVILVNYLDSRTGQYCAANNLTLGEVDAIAWMPKN